MATALHGYNRSSFELLGLQFKADPDVPHVLRNDTSSSNNLSKMLDDAFNRAVRLLTAGMAQLIVTPV